LHLRRKREQSFRPPDGCYPLFNTAEGCNALNLETTRAGNTGLGWDSLFNTVIGDHAGQDLSAGQDNIYIGATAGNGAGDESGTIRVGDPTFVSACFVAGINGQTATGGSAVFVDANGKLGTVTTSRGSPLSANELLKERQVVQELKATTEKQAARIALQEGQIHALTAALKQQAEKIQKVSAQLEMIGPAPRVVENR
jgi:hypothetical protein